MTSEEFAKELTRVDAMRLMGAPVYTLAKDYLALSEEYRKSAELSFKEAREHALELAQLREKVKLADIELFMASENAKKWRGRYEAEHAIAVALHEKLQTAPVEYVTEAISRDLYKWLREIGLPIEVESQAPQLAEGYVWVRYPKEPK